MTGLRCEWVASALSMLSTYLQMQSIYTVAARVALPSLFSFYAASVSILNSQSYNDPKCWDLSSQITFKTGPK